MLAFIASLLFGVLVAEGKMPIPDWASQVKAQSLIQDVYGKELEAARDPKQKAALAREILAVARKEPDPANKFVALETARRLAIEGKDGTAALDVVAAQVESFASESDGDPDGLLARAETLWGDAERKRGEQRLAQRLEAAELWLRSATQSPLMASKWNARMEQIRIGGAVILKARDAILHAVRATYASEFDSICFWRDHREYMEWKAHIDAGEYYIDVTYSGLGPSVTVPYALDLFRNSAPKSSVKHVFRVESSGAWREYRTVRVGRIRVPENEHMRIVLYAMATTPQDFINLRSVALVPNE